MRYIFALSVLLVSVQAYGQDTISISRALRIDESLKIAVEIINSDAVEQITDFHNSMLEYQEAPTKSQQKKLDKLLSEGVEDYRAIIDVERVHNAWLDYFHSRFTDEELLEIVRFAGSPIGKKLFSEINNSSLVIDREFSSMHKKYDKFFEDYDSKIEEIFAE